jgi:hypothetical protein
MTWTLSEGDSVKVILKNPSNSNWKQLRPPAIMEPAYFNLPEEQVLESPRVYDPYTSPYRGKKCVILQTETNIPQADLLEAKALSDAVNVVVRQEKRGMTNAERHQVSFHPHTVIGLNPPMIDVLYGRTLGCSMEDSANFTFDVIAEYKAILKKFGGLWRLYLNAGFNQALQLTIFSDAVLIGDKLIDGPEEPAAIAAWQIAARDCWSSS